MLISLLLFILRFTKKFWWKCIIEIRCKLQLPLQWDTTILKPVNRLFQPKKEIKIMLIQTKSCTFFPRSFAIIYLTPTRTLEFNLAPLWETLRDNSNPSPPYSGCFIPMFSFCLSLWDNLLQIIILLFSTIFCSSVYCQPLADIIIYYQWLVLDWSLL